MSVLPMFPLGAVLFPNMPLALRVFEPRYLQLMIDLLETERREFGVVLIERGFEVGGGDHRFDFGTVARLVEVAQAEDSVNVVAIGGDRISIDRWLPDDPYPRAEVSTVPDLVWSEQLGRQYDDTARTVRRCLSEASEFSNLTYPADVELSDDPPTACWQLAGIIPAGPMDQIKLLQSTEAAELLADTAAQAESGVELLRLAAEEQGPE